MFQTRTVDRRPFTESSKCVWGGGKGEGIRHQRDENKVRDGVTRNKIIACQQTTDH